MSAVTLALCWDEKVDALAQLSIPNKQEYAGRHGYRLEARREHGIGLWAKAWIVNQLLPALEEGAWLMVMDVDTLVMNMAVKVEDRCFGHADLVLAYDINGLNNGVFFVRRTDWALDFMGWWQRDGKRWGDDDLVALAFLLYREPKEKWQCVSQRAFNAYDYDLLPHLAPYPRGHFQPGDFILHLAGVPMDVKMLEMRRRLEEVVR